MGAMKYFATLLVVLCLFVAAPGPGWGGGADVILGSPQSNHGGGGHLTASPQLRKVNPMDHLRGGAQPATQSWFTWLWNMLVSLYGQNFRSLEPTSTP